jgi:hypothetical protein
MWNTHLANIVVLCRPQANIHSIKINLERWVTSSTFAQHTDKDCSSLIADVVSVIGGTCTVAGEGCESAHDVCVHVVHQTHWHSDLKDVRRVENCPSSAFPKLGVCSHQERKQVHGHARNIKKTGPVVALVVDVLMVLHVAMHLKARRPALVSEFNVEKGCRQ